MTGYEEQLLTRAEVLEDTGDLVQAITARPVRARRARASTRPPSPAWPPPPARSTRAPAPATTRAASRTGAPAAGTAPTASSSRPQPEPRATSPGGCGKGSSFRNRPLPRWPPRRTPSLPPTRCPSRRNATAATPSGRPRSPKRCAVSGCARPLRRSSVRSRSGSARRSASCGRSPKTSARFMSWFTSSSGRAAGCPSTPGGSKVKERAHERRLPVSCGQHQCGQKMARRTAIPSTTAITSRA